MNANELADWIEDESVVDIMLTSQEHYRGLVATMLRQLQAEIEALKKEAALQRLSDFTQEADNEPVAWMEIEYGGFTEYKILREPVSSKSIPLYTHPAKTLTDEEIIEMVDDAGIKCGDSQAVYFARAILRKAQEK